MSAEIDSNPKPGEYWTINYLVRGNTVCLARHGRGPGKGLRNGYGGKGKPPVPPAWTMQIEQYAESRVVPVHWSHRGTIVMGLNGLFVPAHLYVIDRFLGEPTQTLEMEDPCWYPQRGLPYDEMWPGDRYFLPKIFQGKRIGGTLAMRDGELECLPDIYELR